MNGELFPDQAALQVARTALKLKQQREADEALRKRAADCTPRFTARPLVKELLDLPAVKRVLKQAKEQGRPVRVLDGLAGGGVWGHEVARAGPARLRGRDHRG